MLCQRYNSVYKKAWEAFEHKRKVAIENHDYMQPLTDLNEESLFIKALEETLGPDKKVKR